MSQRLLRGKGRRGIRSRVRFKAPLRRRIRKIERKLRSAIELNTANTFNTLITSTLNATPIVVQPMVQVNTAVDHGFKVLMKFIEIRAEVRQNLASNLADDWRVDLVLDKLPNGATIASVADVYGDPTPDITHIPLFRSRDRFRVLRSWKGLLNEVTGVGRMFGGKIPLNVMAVSKTADNFVPTTMIKNSLVIFLWTTATANQPVVTMHFQTIFENAA